MAGGRLKTFIRNKLSQKKGDDYILVNIAIILCKNAAHAAATNPKILRVFYVNKRWGDIYGH
jgi:hypothetical protein